MKNLWTIPVIVLTCAFMFGCGNSTKSELKKIVEQNLKAAQEEKLDLYLADLDDSIAVATRPVMQKIFAAYDLSYKLVSFKLLSSTDTTAQVEIVQETRKVKGPDFRDNRSTAIHTFKKGPKGWKFVASKITEVKML